MRKIVMMGICFCLFGASLGSSQTLPPTSEPADKPAATQIYHWNSTGVASFAMTSSICWNSISAACANHTYEECEAILPLPVWDQCATEWEKRTEIEGEKNPAVSFIAIEFLMEAGLRSSGYFKRLSYVKRVGKIVEKFQKVFGADGLKRLDEMNRQQQLPTTHERVNPDLP